MDIGKIPPKVWDLAESLYSQPRAGIKELEVLRGFWPLVVDWWASEELDLGNLPPARSLHSQDDDQHLHWETGEENTSNL